MKVHLAQDQDGKHTGWLIFCPGCACGHFLDFRWTFNGDRERPTFAPSYLVYENPLKGDEVPGYRQQKRCHSFIRNGQIEFLGDCGHALANKTVPLPDLDS